jgi:hypothetical protein
MNTSIAGYCTEKITAGQFQDAVLSLSVFSTSANSAKPATLPVFQWVFAWQRKYVTLAAIPWEQNRECL